MARALATACDVSTADCLTSGCSGRAAVRWLGGRAAWCISNLHGVTPPAVRSRVWNRWSRQAARRAGAVMWWPRAA